MAHFPIPIGIDRMLLDIAVGIGSAARALPERSRSAVGAVALKRANVQIDFELSSAAQREEGFAGLGAKTFLFGFGSSAETREEVARNHGRIELEIVAIVEPTPEPDSEEKAGGGLTRPDPTTTPDPATIREAIDAARADLHRLPLSDAERDKLAEDLNEALALLSRGDLDGAKAKLDRVRKIIATLAQQPRTIVRDPDSR